MATKKKIRSPNYPSISLEEALSRAETLRDKEGIHFASEELVSKHWGYKSTSSGGALITAALRSYGLAETAGSGSQRQVKVSEFGRRLLLDNRPDSIERQNALREAALRPKLHRELWEKWGHELPSKENIRYYLTVDRGFNEKRVDDFIDEYMDTLEFSRLLGSTNISSSLAPEDHGDEEPTMQSTVTQVPRPAEAAINKPIPMTQGEQEFLRGKLPGGRHFRFLVSGDVDYGDLLKVIRLLRSQADLLDESAEDEGDREPS